MRLGNIISLMMTGRISSPTLQAWLLMRFSCKVPSSSDEMLLLHNEPKPVVMPYKVLPTPQSFLSDNRSTSVRSLASGPAPVSDFVDNSFDEIEGQLTGTSQ